jgi:hypothetical protein
MPPTAHGRTRRVGRGLFRRGPVRTTWWLGARFSRVLVLIDFGHGFLQLTHFKDSSCVFPRFRYLGAGFPHDGFENVESPPI